MKKFTLLSLLVLFAAAFSALNVSAAINQEKKNAILNAADQAILLETIQQPGTSEDDVFMKGIACRRLAVIGEESAIPVLAKMLREDERLSYFARYALEMMPFAGIDSVLLEGAQNIEQTNQRVGCVLSLGVRGCSAAVPVLKGIAANPKTPCDKKAAYAALGMIASEDAANFLMECAKKTSESDDYAVRKALADAMLDAAEAFEKAGNLTKAAQINDAVVVPCFPVYAQKAGAYHGQLVRKAQAAPILVTKLHSPKECCFTGGLKTIREYALEDGAAITNACIAELPKLCPERRALVLRALSDRTDEASRKLVFPVAKELTKAAEIEVKIAAIQSLKKLGTICPMEAADALVKAVPAADAPERQAVLNAAVETASVWKCAKLDAALAENLGKVDLKDVPFACAYFQLLENRRVKTVGPELVKIAKIADINALVRDRVLAALSEIVTLDSLNLLVAALDGETNDEKVSWILRAACTRLPREDCAVAVAKMFDAEQNVEEKAKLLTLLKQIGGKTALACVEKACWTDTTADAATQVLGTWNTPDDALAVADACLKLAKDCPVERYQIRGIRSYIRIPRQFDLPSAKKFEMCRTAFETAKRPEDKALIFEVFKRVIELESAKQAFSYAADPAYAEAAYEAVVAIGKKFQGQSYEFGSLLDEVAKKSKNAETVQEAKVVRGRLAAALENAPIVILSAKYGAGAKMLNVTEKVRSMFNGKSRLPIPSFNAAFSDPAPGVVKALVIEVQMKETGEKRTLTFEENEDVLLPIK